MQGQFETICQKIIDRLRNELDPGLLYHNLSHTLDVIEQAESIAKAEGIQPGHDLELLKIGAAYHDSGFLFTYKNHEEKSCEILRKDLTGILPKEDLEKICGMIMATKIPQTPHNLLEKIICDADLDYLGRNDFEPISKNLYKEFIAYGILNGETKWDDIQIIFFEMHNYFTETAQLKRKTKKSEHLHILKERNGRPS